MAINLEHGEPRFKFPPEAIIRAHFSHHAEIHKDNVCLPKNAYLRKNTYLLEKAVLAAVARIFANKETDLTGIEQGIRRAILDNAEALSLQREATSSRIVRHIGMCADLQKILMSCELSVISESPDSKDFASNGGVRY